MFSCREFVELFGMDGVRRFALPSQIVEAKAWTLEDFRQNIQSVARATPESHRSIGRNNIFKKEG